jgi:hypothetical protein
LCLCPLSARLEHTLPPAPTVPPCRITFQAPFVQVAEAADAVREVFASKTITPFETIFWMPPTGKPSTPGPTEATLLFRNSAMVYRSRQIASLLDHNMRKGLARAVEEDAGLKVIKMEPKTSAAAAKEAADPFAALAANVAAAINSTANATAAAAAPRVAAAVSGAGGVFARAAATLGAAAAVVALL